jgi:hypothetical protein
MTLCNFSARIPSHVHERGKSVQHTGGNGRFQQSYLEKNRRWVVANRIILLGHHIRYNK